MHVSILFKAMNNPAQSSSCVLPIMIPKWMALTSESEPDPSLPFLGLADLSNLQFAEFQGLHVLLQVWHPSGALWDKLQLFGKIIYTE